MIRNQRDRERGLPVLTVFTILWCVAVFFMISARSGPPSRWGMLTGYDIYHGAVWGLITSAFVHIEPVHLLFNMYWAYYLGGAMERSIGPGRWLAFVIVSAFVTSGLELMSGASGIGFSGVVYAMFGFAWLTRRRYPEFSRIANNQTVQIFIGWGILCVVATYAGWMNIGNVAHFSGLAFGCAVGAALEVPSKRPWFGAALLLLFAGAVLPLFWSPLSPEWVSLQASKAHQKERLAEAIPLYRRAIVLGDDITKEWAWHNLANIYGYQEDAVNYREALEELRKLSPEDAAEVEKDYGDGKESGE